MSYTAEDRASVQAAILALATGARKTVVTFSTPNGGSRTVQYASVQLDELKELLAQMDAELAVAAGTRRTVLTTSKKGL